MRRLHIHFTVAVLTFFTAVAVDSFLKSLVSPVQLVVQKPEYKNYSTYTPIDPIDDQSVSDYGPLKIVTKEVQLTSERLRYEVDVRYPQILSTHESQVRGLNRLITSAVKEKYEWLLHPSKQNLKHYRKFWPEVFNSVDLDSEVLTANESLVSIYLNAQSYGIGAAHGNQSAHAINYDLRRRKELRLSAIFRPGSKYLEFISRRCATELSNRSKFDFSEALAGSKFENWNVTRNGIRFNFERCELLSCSEGEQRIEIPFADLKPYLKEEGSNELTQSLSRGERLLYGRTKSHN